MPATTTATATATATAASARRPAPRIARELCEATPWKVAGVDYAVGVPSMATLTDWQNLSGPGITVNATVTPPYVPVENKSNVVISGVDFSLHGGATGMEIGPHPNLLQFGTNSNSASIDVEYNTSYQTHQVAGGEVYQFYDNGPNPIQNVTLAYNVIIAAGSGIAVSYMVHGGGAQNAGVAHDNYIDRTASYGWLYPGSFTGWHFSNNYNMTTGVILPGSP